MSFTVPAITPLSDVVWHLHLPLTGPRVSANDRGKWRNSSIPSNTDGKALIRRQAHLAARVAGLPKNLGLIKIDMFFHEQPGRGRIQDVSNYQPTSKAVQDGLADYGLIPNDSDKYVVGPHVWRGQNMPRGHHAKRSVSILITEIHPPAQFPYDPELALVWGVAMRSHTPTHKTPTERRLE